MKTVLALLCMVFVFVSCKNDTKDSTLKEEAATTETTENSLSFNWLSGVWQRISEDNSQATYEKWERMGSQFKGRGWIVKNEETVWEEYMLFRKVDTTWVLSVETPGNDDLVDFRLTDVTDHSFTVENPEHDFPQKIHYFIEDDQLKAVISAGEEMVLFEFEKLN